MDRAIRIGTRASKLAQTQARMVAEALARAHAGLRTEIVPMTTAGDRELHKKISDWGYKGLFTRELEEGLTRGEIDLAVHSLKDMPSALPPELRVAAVLPRAPVADAWVSPRYASLQEVPPASEVATASTRRAAQLRHHFPQLAVIPIRGNVLTRLEKIAQGSAAGTFLAAAGLERLGLGAHIRQWLPLEMFLPAAAQGAIGVECLRRREDITELLRPIHCPDTADCIEAERALLHALDGSCRSAIAALAQLSDAGTLWLRAELLSADGRERVHDEIRVPRAQAAAAGTALGLQLRARGGHLLNARDDA